MAATEVSVQDGVSGLVIAAALRVHCELGPGLLESVYELCLCRELELLGAKVQRQKQLDLNYAGMLIPNALRIDLLVEEQLIVEIKSVDQLQQIHTAQLLTYLKLSGLVRGLLLNFNVHKLKEGIRRVTNFRLIQSGGHLV